MAIIPKTTVDTIKRIKNDVIEDLLDIYNSKDLTKEKENLLTIYLNADVGYSYVKSFYDLGYELQVNKIDVSCLENFIDHYFQEYDMKDFSKFFKNESVSQNVLRLSLYFPKIELLKKAMEIDNVLNKNCLKDFFHGATQNLFLNNDSELDDFIKIVDEVIDIVANNKKTDVNCINFFKEENVYELISQRFRYVGVNSNLIEGDNLIKFNVEKWEKTMNYIFLQNKLENKNHTKDKKIKI